MQKKNLSGYNVFLRERINSDKKDKTWAKLKNCIIYDVTGSGFKVDIDVENDLSGKLYIGTSKYSMLKEFTGVFSENKYTFKVTGLSKKTKYYFYMKNTSTGEVGRTGIYYQKTGIKVYLDIDIGCPAIDRPFYLTGPRTAINRGNPANATGIINKVEIYANTELTDCKVATFYAANGNRLSTRDYVVIGTVPGGSKKTFTVSISVQEGDYLGIFFRSGEIERDGYEQEGVWYTGTEQIPCSSYEFSLGGTWAISLYGEGIGPIS